MPVNPEIESRLKALEPIWKSHNRQLFRGRNGAYIIRGFHDVRGEDVFYYYIARGGACSRLPNGNFGFDDYYITVSCFQQASLNDMSVKVGNWFAQRRA